MITFKSFSFAEELPNMEEMFRYHWEEVASNKGSRKLNVFTEAFIAAEKEGSLLCVGAFDEDRIVGYSVNFLHRDTHDRTKKLCQNDALYVSLPYRQGSIGVKLIQKTELLAKEAGAHFVLWHAKVGSALDLLLDRKGYHVKDLIYAKEI